MHKACWLVYTGWVSIIWLTVCVKYISHEHVLKVQLSIVYHLWLHHRHDQWQFLQCYQLTVSLSVAYHLSWHLFPNSTYKDLGPMVHMTLHDHQPHYRKAALSLDSFPYQHHAYFQTLLSSLSGIIGGTLPLSEFIGSASEWHLPPGTCTDGNNGDALFVAFSAFALEVSTPLARVQDDLLGAKDILNSTSFPSEGWPKGVSEPYLAWLTSCHFHTYSKHLPRGLTKMGSSGLQRREEKPGLAFRKVCCCRHLHHPESLGLSVQVWNYQKSCYSDLEFSTVWRVTLMKLSQNHPQIGWPTQMRSSHPGLTRNREMNKRRWKQGKDWRNSPRKIK